jgi:hypothetical protein
MTPRIPPCSQGASRGSIPAAVLAPGKERRGRTEYAVPAAGGVHFRAGQRCLFGGKTALGIPARTAALPGTKTQAIMVQTNFEIGSREKQGGANIARPIDGASGTSRTPSIAAAAAAAHTPATCGRFTCEIDVLPE